MSGALNRSSSAPPKNVLPPQELLDDLCSRFVLNVPKEDQQSFERILFLVEMEDGEFEHSESRDKIITIYSDFMTRITQFEELVSLGSRLLLGFQQALGFLGRPEINKTSTLVERIIKAHDSRRVLSYIEAGCFNSHDSLQNVRKLNTCHLGLLDYVNKATVVMDEFQSLLDGAAFVVRTAQEKVEDASFGSDSVISSDEEEEPSSDLSKPRVEDYASTMAIIYSMVKQDYTMQVKIASSLNHKSSQGEMETYCQMWSLRPFVDDEIMLSAWALVSKP